MHSDQEDAEIDHRGMFSTWGSGVANDQIYPSRLANFDETMTQPHTNLLELKMPKQLR
jgi:hypothetical protein